MILHNIKITNFKSIYGTQTLDFDKCKGLVKLSGPIGSGKTTIAEAILAGLFGSVNDQRNNDLTAWNTKTFQIDMNLTSKNKEVHIMRNINGQGLVVEVDGKTLVASNKRDTQSILEEEIYDVPKLAIIKMCVISFNEFGSLAKMSAFETKQFLDNIFGFKLFTEYNNAVVQERKDQQNESIKLNSIYDETIEQIKRLKYKKEAQQVELQSSIDTDKLKNDRQDYIDKGIAEKKKKLEIQQELNAKLSAYNDVISQKQKLMTEAATLGRQAKNHYNTFKSGICPTCGQQINAEHIQSYKSEMEKYAADYRKYESEKKELEQKQIDLTAEYNPSLTECDNNMIELKRKINTIDSQIAIYNNNLKLINENFDDLIFEAEQKLETLKTQIDNCDIEIGQWNDMNELFTKTLRFNLIERLIPSINRSIQYFIDKLEQPFGVKFDQEFKAHISVETFGKEIRYNNLSTGQKKTLDLAIIFGILQNVISSVNFNVLVLDELFSNMDANARNTMLSLLNDSLSEDKTIFIINHAEMNDDYFNHKIRVGLVKKKIVPDIRGVDEAIVDCSKYEQVF